MSKVVFENNSVQVKKAISKIAIAFLNEAGSELASQTARNTRVDIGTLKNSWSYVVKEEMGEATIGSALQNAIWEEFGTGEHALDGSGRKTPWHYKDRNGKWHTTRGKKPTRAFFNAYAMLKNKIIARAEQLFLTLGE